MSPKDSNEIANSEEADQTAPAPLEAIPPSPHGVPRTSLFCWAYRVPCKILLAYQILCFRLLTSIPILWAGNMSHIHVEMPIKHGLMINMFYRAYSVLLMMFFFCLMQHVCTSIGCVQQRRHSSPAWCTDILYKYGPVIIYQLGAGLFLHT